MALEYVLLSGIDPEKISDELRRQLDIASARGSDIVRGKLALYSTREILHARTGTLGKSWQTTKIGEGSYVVHSYVPYARIHEEGGEIKPKNVQNLPVPLPAAMGSGRMTKYPSARAAKSAENLFFFKSKAGNLLMAKKTGRDKLELWYVLKKSVTMPATHYATKAVEAARAGVENEINKAIARAAAAMKGGPGA